MSALYRHHFDGLAEKVVSVSVQYQVDTITQELIDLLEAGSEQ
ncbi:MULTISPECIES: hypothetical protein [Shewanella]|nr:MULTISPECIES: hypothetical protein [Shewanella]